MSRIPVGYGPVRLLRRLQDEEPLKRNMEREQGTTPGPVKISACMMVKDEEEMLPGCLDSIRPVADEIIVVDTGSTDRTMEIARSYGADVYQHPWENDFSRHRNQSISYASGDWLLMIDADERLNSDRLDIPRMKEMLSTFPSDVHGLLVTINDFDREGSIKSVFKFQRFFRNGVGVRYEGIVHNQPKITGKVVPSDLELSHHGYDLTPEKMERKFHRTSTLLKQRVEEDPQDFDAYYYLSYLYASRERYSEAVQYGSQCLRYLPESHQNRTAYQGAYYSIGASYAELGAYREAKEWLREGIKALGDDVDLYYALTTASVRSHDYRMLKEAARGYSRALESFRQDPMTTGLRFTHCADKRFEDEVRYRLLCAHLALGETGAVEDTVGEILPSLLGDTDRMYEVLHNLAAVGADGLLLQYTGEFLRERPDENRLIEPLGRRFCQISQLGQSKEEFLNRIDLYDGLAHWCADPPLGADDPSPAREIAGFLERTSNSNGWNDSLLVCLASAYSEFGFAEAADRIYRKGLSRPGIRQALLQNGLYHFYDHGSDAHTDRFLERLLESCRQYDELPERVLLILSHRIMDSSDETHLAEITRVLVHKEDPLRDDPILSRQDLENAYAYLAEQYRLSERPSSARTAYRMAHALSGAPAHLVREGDMYFEAGDYTAALRTYRELLAVNYLDDGLLSRARKALDHLAGVHPAETVPAL